MGFKRPEKVRVAKGQLVTRSQNQSTNGGMMPAQCLPYVQCNMVPNKQVSEKLSEYQDLKTEISRTWVMKTYVAPVIIGALGLVKNRTGKFTDLIPSNINIQTV